jgi:hypothetical protein
MRRRKWFVPVVVVLSVLLIGGIAGGIVAAAGDDSSSIEEQTEAANRYQVLLDRACAIYEESTGVVIDSEQLMDALRQARQELRDEALEAWLQKLVEDGKITQGEADQYLEWWQSRPDIELPLPALGKLARAFQIRVAPWCALGAPSEAGG